MNQPSQITVRIIDGCLEPRTYHFSPNQTVKFDCPAGKCHGVDKGFDFTNIIRDMLRHGDASRTVKVNCGGFGDEQLAYSCDNFVVTEILL